MNSESVGRFDKAKRDNDIIFTELTLEIDLLSRFDHPNRSQNFIR